MNPLRAFQNAIIVRNVVARTVRAMEHNSPEALKQYLHDHPDADKSKHTVKKPERPSESGSSEAKGNPKAQKRFEESKKTLSDMEGLLKKVENANDGAKKKFDRAYDKLMESGDSTAKDAEKLLKEHGDSKEKHVQEALKLLDRAMREWDNNKMRHDRAADGMAKSKLNQAQTTYGHAQEMEAIVKDFAKLLKDPNAKLDTSWRS